MKVWGGFLVLLLVVLAATSWWSSLPTPDEPEEISCPDIEDVIGEPTWDEYKACQGQYYAQLIRYDIEKLLYRLEYLKRELLGI